MNKVKPIVCFLLYLLSQNLNANISLQMGEPPDVVSGLSTVVACLRLTGMALSSLSAGLSIVDQSINSKSSAERAEQGSSAAFSVLAFGFGALAWRLHAREGIEGDALARLPLIIAVTLSFISTVFSGLATEISNGISITAALTAGSSTLFYLLSAVATRVLFRELSQIEFVSGTSSTAG